MTLKNILCVLFSASIFVACSKRVIPISTTQDPNVAGMTQNFDETKLLGKWLTNMPAETTSFITFRKDNTVTTDTNRDGTYIIKKDSIIITYSDATARGRLLEQTDSRIFILWGNADAVKFYRPE